MSAKACIFDKAPAETAHHNSQRHAVTLHLEFHDPVIAADNLMREYDHKTEQTHANDDRQSGGLSAPVDPSSFPSEPRTAVQQMSWSQRSVVWAAMLVLMLPLGYGALKREVARWYAAASQRAAVRGDVQQSIALLNRALAWDTDNIRHTMDRCGRKLQTGNAQMALEDSDHALRLARAAAADQLNPISIRNLVHALNLRAYTHALAEDDIAGALENIEEAFSILGQESYSAFLDTRAYLKYLHGDYDDGLQDAEAAVDLYDSERLVQRASYRQRAQSYLDKTPLEYEDRRLDEAMAVLYQHRGLLYEALERLDEADKDFVRAKQLGYDPANGVW
jgi:tetratricopeptide (TPR) repeat protein